MENEELELLHNKIIGWTENCDNKSSIILTLLGVCFSILFSSDFVIKSIQSLIKIIFSYKPGDDACFIIDCLGFIFLIESLLFFVLSFFSLMKSLTANIDLTQQNCHSALFFGTIAKGSIDEYKTKINIIEADEIKEDKINQIYICSVICNKKFTKYNDAIIKIKYGLSFLLLFLTFSLMTKCI